LCENVEALLYKEIGIEGNESERQRENIVAGAYFEEIANRFLWRECKVSGKHVTQQLATEMGKKQAMKRTRPSCCSRSSWLSAGLSGLSVAEVIEVGFAAVELTRK
jgi:rubredoxin